MQGNFFRRSTDDNQRVNRKVRILALVNKTRNVENDSPASSGGQEKYMIYVRFLWTLLEAARSILKFSRLLLLFERGLIKT
jgi:hypothetical protein